MATRLFNFDFLYEWLSPMAFYQYLKIFFEFNFHTRICGAVYSSEPMLYVQLTIFFVPRSKLLDPSVRWRKELIFRFFYFSVSGNSIQIFEKSS